MSDLKPGLYAVDSWRGDGQLAFRSIRGGRASWCVLDGEDTRGLDDAEISDARPLIVLDLNDPARVVGALTDAIEDNGDGVSRFRLRSIRDQIEAQTKPPKPDEPKGLGAVAEDAKGHKFVRVADPIDGWMAGRAWQRIGGDINAVRNFGWDAVDAVAVLSEGVKP